MLGTIPGSSAREVCTLNCGVISPAPIYCFQVTFYYYIIIMLLLIIRIRITYYRCAPIIPASAWEVEAGGMEVQSSLQLHSEFKANLDQSSHPISTLSPEFFWEAQRQVEPGEETRQKMPLGNVRPCLLGFPWFISRFNKNRKKNSNLVAQHSQVLWLLPVLWVRDPGWGGWGRLCHLSAVWRWWLVWVSNSNTNHGLWRLPNA